MLTRVGGGGSGDRGQGGCVGPGWALTCRFLAFCSLLSPSSSSPPEAGSSAASCSRNSQRHWTGSTSREPSLDCTRSASQGMDCEEAWAGGRHTALSSQSRCRPPPRNGPPPAGTPEAALCTPEPSLRGPVSGRALQPTVSSNVRAPSASGRAPRSLGGTHLPLDDVEEEVGVPATTQQVPKAQGLVEAFHLVQDVRGRPPRRPSESARRHARVRAASAGPCPAESGWGAPACLPPAVLPQARDSSPLSLASHSPPPPPGRPQAQPPHPSRTGARGW